VNDRGTGRNWACFNHEMKPKSLSVIAAMPFAHGDSHHYHLIFCSIKKSFITSNAALPLALPFMTYKIKYTPEFPHHLELVQTSLTKLHL